jgi:hypothetical protein
MSSFGLYVLGFIIVIAGLAYAATLVGVPPVWIGVGVIILAGIAIATGATKTRRKDETETSERP